MTAWDLARLIVRRWYVVLVGAVITGGVAGWALIHPGVYWSQVDVVFLAPQSARYPNTLTTMSGSIVSTAGIVERVVNHARSAPETSSSTATLVGQGVTDGSSITLPDAGGQWAHNFNRQVLDVEVVGPDAADVRRRQTELIDEISAALHALQVDAGVSPENFITVEPSPVVPSISYFHGDAKRAWLMIAALGTALTTVAARAIDRRLTGRQGSRSSRELRPTPAH